MCGMNTLRGMAPNAQFNEADIKPKFGLPRIPTGHAFDRIGAAMMKRIREKADPKTRAIFEGIGKEQIPPKRSSSTSGGPTRLGIGRRPSTRKRGRVSGRSRSKRKAFSTKR